MTDTPSRHHFDGAGICMKCDRCEDGKCCDQMEECDGQNWAFLSRPIFICPYRVVIEGEHQVKWNNGSPVCLNCDAPAVFARPKKDRETNA